MSTVIASAFRFRSLATRLFTSWSRQSASRWLISKFLITTGSSNLSHIHGPCESLKLSAVQRLKTLTMARRYQSLVSSQTRSYKSLRKERNQSQRCLCWHQRTNWTIVQSSISRRSLRGMLFQIRTIALNWFALKLRLPNTYKMQLEVKRSATLLVLSWLTTQIAMERFLSPISSTFMSSAARQNCRVSGTIWQRWATEMISSWCRLLARLMEFCSSAKLFLRCQGTRSRKTKTSWVSYLTYLTFKVRSQRKLRALPRWFARVSLCSGTP